MANVLRALFLTLLVALTWSSPLHAWRPETRVRLVDEAIRLMPATLRLALENHRNELLRGLLEPMTGEGEAAHRPPWSEGGALAPRLEAEINRLGELLADPTSFGAIARQFGIVAHFLTDAGFPPGMSAADGATRYDHFSSFCESRREKFPVVFYGHEDSDLARGDFGAFTLAMMKRARNEDRDLQRAYAAAGDPPNPAAFDDRSVPFAVASLSYSHTFTDIVRVWLTSWERAGGDMARTPYLDPDNN